jgi:phosphoglycolate phosphatase
VDAAPTFRAAIFDLDGTLVDSTTTLVDAANYALENLGYNTYTVEEIRPMLGGGTRKLMQRALTRALGSAPDPLLLDRACKLKMEFENSPAGQEAKVPFEGALEMLRSLQTAGVQLGVLSNTMEANVQKQVAKHFGEITFAHVAGARDDTPLKPNPFAALRISNELMVDIRPKDCVFIGDSEFDMKTGKAAGMTPLAVPWGIRASSTLVEHGAAAVVATMEEISGFIVGRKH